MDIAEKLKELIKSSRETEVLEFKEAGNSYNIEKLGQYFSALSNEANLRGHSEAWLIFGIDDDKKIVGSNFRKDEKHLHNLKEEIASKTTPRITFIDISETLTPQGRVVLFKIPPAPKGMPVAYAGHYYSRNGESLVPMDIEKIERIRAQEKRDDWSAVIIPNATLEDLDEKAMQVARDNFKSKLPEKAAEVDTWDDLMFLNKAKLTIKGKITRTALLLLGKEESAHFLSPADPTIRWVLKDKEGNERDYALFRLPFLLAVDKVYAKIRNLKYRYIKEGSLFPEEIDQYDSYSIREALNNCIAHQDYLLAGRINVIEKEESLIFTNLGSFVAGDVQKVIFEDAPEQYYRNRFLVDAMFSLKMVDTAGGGIRKLFLFQKDRFLPLPDYDISQNRVQVTLTGKVLNIDYAKMLARNSSLTLPEVVALDKIQKKLPLNLIEEKMLKAKGLIEGRKPHFYIAKEIAQKTNQKAVYSKNKAFHKQYYLDLILKSLTEHGSLSRQDIDDLLFSKLYDWMNEKQKKYKIGNLLGELRRKKEIKNMGSMKKSSWVLVKKGEKSLL